MSQSELNRPNSGNSRRNPRDNRNRFSKQNYVTDNKYYQRECTVRVEKIPTQVIGERVVIEDIETLTGMNTVLAVVRCDLSSYDVTFDCKENAFKMLRGVEIANRDFECSMMFSDITVVSVIKLPSYICDDEITSKIECKGVKVVSPVYRRTVPGTQVADGTRFMRSNDNDSEVIIQRRPDENHADDEDTETVVKFIVSENVHDNESIAIENCIEDEAKQDSEAKIQLDGSDKIGKTDVSNLTIVEVEVHNEQNGAPDGLKRKRPISEDGIDDNDDQRTDSSIETDIIERKVLLPEQTEN
ncbi:unnamed protein product [Mytilus coruscus]|uniref:Uncharacterized protein n=1 Tax=Mytilus coruscus TaxID=42192 RepID=A0A6J8CQM4_MYTCO|nr:unnamed protein product [Mytilus coruscus]